MRAIFITTIVLLALTSGAGAASSLLDGARLKPRSVALSKISPAARHALRGQRGASGATGDDGSPGLSITGERGTDGVSVAGRNGLDSTVAGPAGVACLPTIAECRGPAGSQGIPGIGLEGQPGHSVVMGTIAVGELAFCGGRGGAEFQIQGMSASSTTACNGAASTVPGPAGPAGADSTVAGPRGSDGNPGTDCAGLTPTSPARTCPGDTGPAGADSTVPGPQGVPGSVAAPNRVTQTEGVASGTVATITSACPSSSHVIGGGYEINDDTSLARVISSRPAVTEAWSVRVRNPPSDTIQVTAFALCVG